MPAEKQAPYPLFDPFVPAMSAWALVTAVRTGVFEIIGEGEVHAEDLAPRLGWDPEGMKRLCELLTAELAQGCGLVFLGNLVHLCDDQTAGPLSTRAVHSSEQGRCCAMTGSRSHEKSGPSFTMKGETP